MLYGNNYLRSKKKKGTKHTSNAQYKALGFDNRCAYLFHVADVYAQPFQDVYRAAMLLGKDCDMSELIKVVRYASEHDTTVAAALYDAV